MVEDVRSFTQVTLPVPSDPGGTLGSAYVYSSSSLQGQYGVFTIAADGTATYTLYNSLPSIQGLGQGETLTDTLAYSVSNSQGVTLPGSFTVTIHGTNDIPSPKTRRSPHREPCLRHRTRTSTTQWPSSPRPIPPGFTVP